MKNFTLCRRTTGRIEVLLRLATVTAWALMAANTLVGSALAASSPEQRNNPGIAPIQSHPHGKSYSEWAATWWKWALQTPASENPLLDRGTCSVGQVGRVWFIGGFLFQSPSGQASGERTCTVPTGTSLFFPLVNHGAFAFLSDPPEQRTEQFLRATAACDATRLTAEIDGVPVSDPDQYFEQSPLFEVHLPSDNVFGFTETDVPQLLLSPSVDSGYYLFLRPLEPGEHSIQWSAQCGANQQNFTYTITVVPGQARRHLP